MSSEGLYATLAYTLAELAALNDPTSPLYAATVAQLRAAGKPVAPLDPQAVAAAQRFRAGDPLQFERLTAQLNAQGYAFPGLASAGVGPVTYNATELAFFREQQRRIDAGLPIITAADLAPLTVRPAMGPVVGGTAMSAGSWFGLSGPGAMSFPTNSFMGSGFSAGNFSDALFGALPTLANTAAQFFLQQQLAKQQEDAAKARLRELQALSALQLGQNGQGQVVVGPDGTISMGGTPGINPNGMPLQGPVWPFMPGAGACAPRGAVAVSPSDAPGIYSQGCSGNLTTRSRFFALRSDGTRDLFVKVGKVQSVSPRTLNRFARRWAKEAGLVASKRGAAGRRGRRRPR